MQLGRRLLGPRHALTDPGRVTLPGWTTLPGRATPPGLVPLPGPSAPHRYTSRHDQGVATTTALAMRLVAGPQIPMTIAYA
jgi:hypothetical protein